MKENLMEERPEPLRNLLQSWRVEAALPPRFAHRVWQRIAEAEMSPRRSAWMAVKLWLETALSRPKVAVAYATILLGAGLAAGYWQGREKAAEAEQAQRAAYVQAVDPFQTLP